MTRCNPIVHVGLTAPLVFDIMFKNLQCNAASGSGKEAAAPDRAFMASIKLDRNINPDGSGKYALINLRKLRNPNTFPKGVTQAVEAEAAIKLLSDLGIIQWGNESPGDQFFVVKYKDRFAADALEAYARAAGDYSDRTSDPNLKEFAAEILNEAYKARRLGNKNPD
jgi:hypothetical protein